MRERGPSLRLRVAATVGGFALLVILGQAIALLLTLEGQEEDFIGEILNRQIAYSLESYARDPVASLPNTPDMHLYRLPAEGPLPSPPALFAGLPVGNHEVFDARTEYHVAVRDQAGGRFFLAYDVFKHEQRLNSIIFFTVSGAVLIGLVTLASVYGMAGRLTRRLDLLAGRVADVRFSGSYAEPGMEREVLAVAHALDAYAARQAQSLARERDFTANLSHELRTPLTAIRTDAELLADIPGLPAHASARARRIIDTVDGITGLAQSLLSLARQAEPKLIEDVNLLTAVRAAWQPFAQAAAAKGLTLSVDIAPSAVLRTDASLLDLTLRNLFQNAVRHSPRGTIRCFLEGTRLTVLDCGPGFAAEQMRHVFERFNRGESGSHGLGLALVQHVCAACGWRVSAANDPVAGARLALDFGTGLRMSLPEASVSGPS